MAGYVGQSCGKQNLCHCSYQQVQSHEASAVAQTESMKYDCNIGIRFQRTTLTSTGAWRDKEGQR